MEDHRAIHPKSHEIAKGLLEKTTSKMTKEKSQIRLRKYWSED
jgi:hypothetical protein